MPDTSKSQWRKMFTISPKLGKEFAHATPGGYASLPEHVQGGKPKRRVGILARKKK